MSTGVSRSFLFQKRMEAQALGIEPEPPRFTAISDEELSEIAQNYFAQHPRNGIQFFQGRLYSLGIKVSRERVRSAAAGANRPALLMRRDRVVFRRVYWVPRPLSLVHLDGYHKLVSWKIVIFGGIDGKTRLIFLLRAGNNNRASSLMKCFKEGVEEVGLPSRIRTDKGGENQRIKEYMERHRGMNRGSCLQGTSTHNQR
jgi:hypothetical protein